MVVEDVVQLVQHGGRRLAMLALWRGDLVAAMQRRGEACACVEVGWDGWIQRLLVLAPLTGFMRLVIWRLQEIRG